jgi:Uma2 family endonuclease
MATVTEVEKSHRPWRLTVSKYLRMIEVGILTEKDRVFLWKGELFEKMTKGRPHVVAVLQLAEALRRVACAPSYYVEQEAPVRLVRRTDTLPEPDLKVVRGRPSNYADAPTTRDVPLIAEVSDSTLAFDMGPNQRLYAVESVPEYWVVSVNRRWIEVFTRPSGPQSPTGYQSRRTYRAGESIPVTLDDKLVGQVSVDEVFA